ncbi:hypothetical protein B5S33_g2270 [[Candida] boidinii]|nr:hypothetical protein B5S33_g2270 [[Candida] boidinii]
MTFAETDKESSAIEGGLVWLQDSENVFVKGTILESLDNGQKVKVQPENSKDTLTINTEQLQRRNPPKFDNCDDMASLTYLNEPSVVYNLQQRYQNDSIYTYSGLFLVAVNPYKQLNIYNNQFIQLYKNSTVTQIENAEEKIEELETPSLSHPDSESTNNIDDNYEIPTRLSTVKPHIFAVAEEAFQNLVQTKSNQSILVTGESGAGKTENTKKVIQYIISVASSATNQSIAQTVEDRILQANPILEAFGNAQTVRNLNSSRFGKFVKINVNIANKELNGAKIEWYLLEKSRVVLQNSDERNYHIFYQFLRGAAEKDLDQFGLSKSLSQYNYLKFSNHTVPGMDDSKEYRTLIKALQIMDFAKQDIQNVFAVLAIILHLGNITFKNKPNDVKQAILDESVSKSIEMISKLFGIKEKDFKNSFLTSKVQAGREVVTQHRNASQAKFTIDALSKSLYERLFQYLVNKINYSFNTEANPMANTRYIGILDIAGFEIFKKNSFEQLCINYTNEKLQQFFNHHMFELEQSEYLKEGIKWDYIDFGQELKPTIDLIEGNKLNKKTGVFLILDEECVVPKGCDKSFLEKLHTQLEYKKSNKSNSNDKANNEKNIRYKPNKIRDGFVVKHYAGEVDYNVDGWLDKNKDPLSSTIVELLTESSNLFISDLFSDSGALPQNVSDSPVKGGRTKKSGMFRTVAQRHREQLQQLMEQLHETHPHFVRCILPNTTKTAGKFDMQLVLEQLKCNGVLEGIRIARSGYPNRVEFKHFVEHYSILAKNQLSTKNSTRNFKQLAEIILGEMDLDANVYKVGLTKLFFRNGALANLEKKRDTKLALLLTNFQSHVRGKLVRDDMNSLMAKMRASDLINKNFQAYSKLSKDPWFVLCSKLKPMLINSNENQTKSIQKLKSLENEIRALKTEKEEYLKLQAETSSELAKFKSEMEADSELMQKKDKELGETKKSLVKLESEIQKAKSSKTELEEINSGLKSTIETLESEKIETSKNISDELSKEKEELQDKLKLLENEIKNFETAKTANDKLSGKLNEEISMLKKQVDQKSKQISEMKSKSFETDNLKNSLEKTVSIFSFMPSLVTYNWDFS